MDTLEGKMGSLSAAGQDYLKAIYLIEQEQGEGRVSTSALADKLQVARASVTGMLKKLAHSKPTLVDYRPYRGVALTPAGRKIALEIIRHHRLVEAYLAEALGYSWDEVHREADQLEHVVSEELGDRMSQYLGHPEVDPHGHPIPDKDGSIRQYEELPLTALAEGQQARILRVSDRDPELLRYLGELGLVLQAEVELLEAAPFEGPLHIRVLKTGETHALSRRVTDQIHVTLVEDGG